MDQLPNLAKILVALTLGAVSINHSFFKLAKFLGHHGNVSVAGLGFELEKIH